MRFLVFLPLAFAVSGFAEEGRILGYRCQSEEASRRVTRPMLYGRPCMPDSQTLDSQDS